jgi:predicted small metal-binding protein
MNQQGGTKIAYTLVCKDFGVDFPYIARGETEEEVLQDGAKHAKEVHGYTDKQINDPKFLEESKKLIKKT